MDSDEMEGCTHAIREAKLYTITEVSELLNLHENTIYRHIKSGKLRAMQPAQNYKIRIFGKDIIQYLRGDK